MGLLPLAQHCRHTKALPRGNATKRATGVMSLLSRIPCYLSVSAALRSAILFSLVLAGTVSVRPAEADDEPSFLPTWKLLDLNQRQQFIAGYLQGWRDAANVTDIAINFVRRNPDKAIASLEGVRELYRLRTLRPSEIVEAVDEFYADPENSTAPLSRAITAARTRSR